MAYTLLVPLFKIAMYPLSFRTFKFLFMVASLTPKTSCSTLYEHITALKVSIWSTKKSKIACAFGCFKASHIISLVCSLLYCVHRPNGLFFSCLRVFVSSFSCFSNCFALSSKVMLLKFKMFFVDDTDISAMFPPPFMNYFSIWNDHNQVQIWTNWGHIRVIASDPYIGHSVTHKKSANHWFYSLF